jgi:hypothetical protein
VAVWLDQNLVQDGPADFSAGLKQQHSAASDPSCQTVFSFRRHGVFLDLPVRIEEIPALLNLVSLSYFCCDAKNIGLLGPHHTTFPSLIRLSGASAISTEHGRRPVVLYRLSALTWPCNLPGPTGSFPGCPHKLFRRRCKIPLHWTCLLPMAP